MLVSFDMIRLGSALKPASRHRARIDAAPEVGDAAATVDRHGPDGSYFSADQMHDSALASVHREFATVVTTAEMLKNLR